MARYEIARDGERCERQRWREMTESVVRKEVRNVTRDVIDVRKRQRDRGRGRYTERQEERKQDGERCVREARNLSRDARKTERRGRGGYGE